MPVIPEFLIYGSMFYLVTIGVVCSRKKIFLDPIYFLIFIPQALMYVFFDVYNLPILDRAPWVRLSLTLIPLCFAVILTLSYWRRARHG